MADLGPHGGPRTDQPAVPPFSEALLALAEIPGIGQRGLSTLVDLYGDALGQLLVHSPDEVAVHLRARHAPARLIEVLSHSSLADTREAAQAYVNELRSRRSRNIHILQPSRLPSRLTRLPDRPRWLFLQGDPRALGATAVAVVGTRTPSPEGTAAARRAVQAMAAYPLSLISGLAAGIDAAAHESALDHDLRTVAFLGHGLDLVFPAETGSLRERILEQGGAIATEYLPRQRYRKAQFVQRNRLQAGLAQSVIVAEGHLHGGTAHTVRFAQRYQTPVIGLDWHGNTSNLIGPISSLPDSRLIDIFTRAGARDLDRLMRAVAEADGHPTNALSRVGRHLLKEAQHRYLRREDLLHLQTLLRTFFERKP